jgi:hypothetical protein
MNTALAMHNERRRGQRPEHHGQLSVAHNERPRGQRPGEAIKYLRCTKSAAANNSLGTTINLTLFNARSAHSRRGPISKRKENIRAFHRRKHQKNRGPPGPGSREFMTQRHQFRHFVPLASSTVAEI